MPSEIRGSDNFSSDTVGKVLQVVSTRFSGQGSITTNTTDKVTSPSITHTITPVASGSNFLVKIRWFGECSNGESTVAHIYRGSSRVNEANTNSYHGLSMPTESGNPVDKDSTPQIMYVETLDETGSTAGTAITYTLKYSAASGTLWTNRCFANSGALHYETGISEIIIMEIGA